MASHPFRWLSRTIAVCAGCVLLTVAALLGGAVHLIVMSRARLDRVAV
ncbi:MAG: hypothetical protein OXD50_03385 [Chloroflexi bacterium]|nr:hypothetical protein [Chloroflexota bacterium]